ncbi:hypothetical protein EDC01DRAFT_759393 [Geopyxis carbonaria]|nr:hypothetical protein EDC01DRAFT_759393 [Geopyxis carbonaria]
MRLNSILLFAASAAAATTDVIMCNTRPLPVDDPTSPSSFMTIVEPLDTAGPECATYAAPLDWTVKIPFKSTPALTKFDNVLTWMQAPEGTMCELYTSPTCSIAAGSDMLSQSDCIGTNKHEGTIGVFFISELPYYQGKGIRCMRCGPEATYSGVGGVPKRAI